MVGPGRVGLSLAVALRRVAGVDPVQVVGRRDDPPEYLTHRDPEVPTESPAYVPSSRWSPPEGAGSLGLFLAVPDDELRSVVEEWAERLAAAGTGGKEVDGASPTLVFHTSGSRSAEALAPLRERARCRVGVFHPLRAVFRPDPDALAGAVFGVAGDEDAVRAGMALAGSLGGRALRVRPERHPQYHAAAVFASNFLVACLEVASREMSEAVEEEVCPDALVPLASSALQAVAAAAGESGPATRGLTGPVARGDTGTLERHLGALDPETGRLYALLTEILARDVAGMRGERLEEVTRVLETFRAGGPVGATETADERDGGS